MNEGFFAGYIDCAIWASYHWVEGEDNPEPLERYAGTDDITAEAKATMKADCDAFIADNKEDLCTYCENIDPGASGPEMMAGHDFWLTRNGHGAGFWDSGTGELGDRLTNAANVYGESNLYLGDDGRVHVAG